MKIWGRANSINVMKVLWTADECGLKYERTDVGLAFGGNDQKWYLDMNPNGVVPTIDDGGRIIWESNTIVRYLAAKYAAGSLWPNDPGLRSEAERWMDWQLSTIHTGMRDVFWGLIRTSPEKRAWSRSPRRQPTRESSGHASTRRSRASSMSQAGISRWAISRWAAGSTLGMRFPSSGPS
jgi:glutathione S-transferase